MTDLLIKRGFDPDRLFTIYNGIDFTPRTPALSREEYFRSVGLEADGDSVVVGIAARLNPVKDIATLVRGFAKAHRECPSLRLLIAGDGEQMSMLKGLAAELGVERQVCFAGWVSDTDSFYHAIDINTLTSLSETFPYSLTEGARAALPTIASRVGGVPYLIEHGVHGLLFEAGDDVEQLMILCEADITSGIDAKVKRYLANFELVRRKMKDLEERDRIRNFQPPITGEIIMQTYGIGPCRAIGDIKEVIKNAILDGEIPNDYDAAYALMERLAAEKGLTKAAVQNL